AQIGETANRLDIIKGSGEVMFGPNIFANGHADFFPPDRERLQVACRFEITILIENVVGRQKRLMSLANWFATLEQGGGIMERLAASFVSINETDEQSRIFHARVKLLEDGKVLRDKTRFENQILRRIPSDGQFRRQDQPRHGSG